MATARLSKGLLRKVNRGLCSTRGCMNRRRKDRYTCNTCDSRKNHQNNPMTRAFHELKHHAKERGIEFALTFHYFEKFAKQSEYIERKGNTAQSLTVDRKDNRFGYVPGNIQPMTRSANTRKMRKFDAIRLTKGWKGRNAKQAEIDKILNDYTEDLESCVPAERQRDAIRDLHAAAT